MEIAASGGADARPPVASHAAPTPDAATRPTVVVRPDIVPELRASDEGVLVTDPYVVKFWTAAIGPGAVADLLRLTRAAARSAPLRRPLYLSVLVREGLAGSKDGRVWVLSRIPFLGPRQLRRLPPGLRAEHRHHIEVRRP